MSFDKRSDWVDYPDLSTPVMAADMLRIENGIEEADAAPKNSLATAENDIIVASGPGVWIKKTLVEFKALIELASYAYLPGRSGGQTLVGGTESSDDLKLQSTSGATKGIINLGDTAYIDEVNKRLGVGTDNPESGLHVAGTTGSDLIKSNMGFDYNPVEPGVGGVALAGDGAGNIEDGTHYYFVTYYTSIGETRISNTSPTFMTIVDKTIDGKVNITLPISSDERVIGRKIYRSKTGNPHYFAFHLATITNNIDTLYVDNISDSLLSITNSYRRENNTGNNFTVNGKNGMMIGSGIEASVVLGLNSGETFFNGTAIGGASVFIGAGSANKITTGLKNNSHGVSIFNKLTSGNFNNAFGWGACTNLTTGTANVAMGHDSSYFNQTGGQNVTIGCFTGFGVSGISVYNNTLIGAYAGYNIAGDANVFIGFKAGYNESGENKLYISNSNTTTPLIYGEFNNKLFRINGHQEIINQNTTDVGQIIKGVAGQSADLLQVKDSSDTKLVVINSSGKVGIGTPTPNSKLKVAGNISADDEIEAYSGRDLLRYNLMMSS